MPAVPAMQDLSKWRLLEKKVSPQLKAWDGMTSSYRQWVERVHDHVNLVNPYWRRLLDFVRTTHFKLNWAIIMQSTVDGLGPQDLVFLANDLYSFLGTVMTDSIHPRREAIAGGEPGNGLE